MTASPILIRPTPTTSTSASADGVFSIDLEDFSQLTCRDATGYLPECSADLDRQIDVILKLLAEHGISGTFFSLGMLASRRPDIIRHIHQAGHEIASHGSQHRKASTQTRAEFAADVGESLKLLQDIIQAPVLGYRAPVFSIVRDNLWALEVLAELGIVYDSSIFPMRLRRYGIAGFDPMPRRYALPAGQSIVEIPLVSWQVGRRHLPIAGGGYLRLMPQWFMRTAIDALRAQQRWLTFYLHPYEFDPQPLDVARSFPEHLRMPAAKRFALNAKWNLRRRSIVPKVQWLCRHVRFLTYGELARRVQSEQTCRPLPLPA
ncbi:MAG TPA: DUF3473 domain-containing protein [Phycisphaerae bacterium]